MATYVLEVDGIARTVDGRSLNIDKQASGIDTLTAIILSESGVPAPALPQVVTVTENGTRIFGGILTSWKRYGATLQDSDLLYEIAASDFNIKPTRRYVNASFPAQTVKQRLQAIIAAGYLGATTLHGSQVDGPTIEERTYNWTRLDDVLLETCQLAGEDYLYEIDYVDVLRVFQAGALPAAYDIEEGDGKSGLISVETMIDDVYANNIILICNGAGPATDVASWVAADGVSSGGFTRFTTKYPASQSIDDAWGNGLYISGVLVDTVTFDINDLITHGGVFRWAWDHANHQLVYDNAGAGVNFPVGSAPLTFLNDQGQSYAIGFPFVVTASDSGEIADKGQIDYLIQDDNVTTIEAAQALADAELARRLNPLELVRYPTTETGLEPGRVQHITAPQVGLNDDALVIGVQSRSENTVLMHDVSAVLGSSVRGKYQDLIRQMFKVGGGGSGETLAATGTAQGSSTIHSRLAAWGSNPTDVAEGDWLVYSNSPLQARYNGSTWDYFFRGFKVSLPDINALTFIQTGGTGAASADRGSIKFVSSLQSLANSVKMLVESTPAQPYSLAIGFSPRGNDSTYQLGVCLRESATGKIASIGMLGTGSGSRFLWNWTGPTGTTSTIGTRTVNFDTAPMVFVKIERSGSTLNYYASEDGYDWQLLYTQSMTTPFTTAPDQYGLLVNSNGNSALFPAAMRCWHYVKA